MPLLTHNITPLLALFGGLFLSTAQADYFAIEVSVGERVGAENHWQGRFPAEIDVYYLQNINKSTYFKMGINHMSNALTGPPFNDYQETTLNRGYIGIGWKFNVTNR